MESPMPAYTPIIGTLGYVMSPDGKSVLLIHRNTRPEDLHYGKYNGLGGKLEAGEDVVAGICREIREEAGIEVEELTLRGTISWPGFGKNEEDWFGFIFRIDRWSGMPLAGNHEGTLEFSEVSVDAGTGSVVLRAVFPNPEHELLPGMFVHAQLVEGLQEQAILAPQQGVTRDPSGTPIALVVNDDNVVELRKLDAERTVGDRWLVNSGLKAGDRLITEGLQFVQPGVKVETMPAGNVTQPVSAAAAQPAR